MKKKDRALKSWCVRAKVDGKIRQISRKYSVYQAARDFADLAEKSYEAVEIREVMGIDKAGGGIA